MSKRRTSTGRRRAGFRRPCIFGGLPLQRSPLLSYGLQRSQRLHLCVEDTFHQVLETVPILTFANSICLFHLPASLAIEDSFHIVSRTIISSVKGPHGSRPLA